MFLLSRLASQAPEVFVTLLVFSLSSGVFGGVLFYVDSAAPSVLTEMSNKAHIDMELRFTSPFSHTPELVVDEVRDVVASQDGILAAESLIFLHIYERPFPYAQLRDMVCLGIDPSFLTVFHDDIRLSDESSPLIGNRCYIEKNRFVAEHLSIGQNYTVRFQSYYPAMGYASMEFVIAGTFESQLSIGSSVGNPLELPYPSLMTSRSYLNDTPSEPTNYNQYLIEDRIWVKFNVQHFARNDPNEITSSLIGIERGIEQTASGLAYISEFRLLSVIGDYSYWLTSIRAITLAFSVPSIVMGILLIQYNSSLLTNQWRGEVGAIRIRGASGRQAFAWVMSFSVVTGLLGSLGAILAGGVAALFSGTAKDIMAYDIRLLSGFELVLLPRTVAALFVFSFLTGLAVAVPAAVRAFLLLPVEAHDVVEREQSKEGAGSTNALRQAALSGVSGVLVVPLLGILASGSLDPSGSILYTVVIVALLGTFVFGTTMLLSRPASAAKSHILNHLRGKSLRVGGLLMARSALTSKRSEALGVMFIALVFTAGIFSSVTATSATNHVRDLIKFRYGADIIVDPKSTLQNDTLQLVEKVSAVPGVAHASGMLRDVAKVGFWREWSGLKVFFDFYMTVYGIQPVDWLESAFVLPYFTYLHPPTESIAHLETSNSSVVASFLPVLGYDVDSLGRRVPQYSHELLLDIYGAGSSHMSNCTIVDVMASSLEGGGQSQTYFPGEWGATDFVVVNLSYLQSCLNTTKLSRIYVRLAEGADYAQVMKDILAADPASIDDVSSPYDDIDIALEARTGQAVTGTYALNLMFSFLYLTAGTCLVVTAKTRTMRRYFSILRALGMEKMPIVVSVLLDSSANMIMGAVVGCVMSSILILLMLNLPLSYLGGISSVNWKDLPMTVVVPVGLLMLVSVTALVFSLLSAFLISRRSLASNIADDLCQRE